jgi:hypothetical protein
MFQGPQVGFRGVFGQRLNPGKIMLAWPPDKIGPPFFAAVMEKWFRVCHG